MKYKLIVVTVTYKPNVTEVYDFLNSFMKYNDLGEQAKLVIVDNSPQLFVDMDKFKALYPMVTIIENPKNPGFGASNNIGFELFESDYVLFMNNDTEFVEPLFKHLINIHEANNTIGCIGIHQKGGSPSFFRKFDAPKYVKNTRFDEKYHFISGAFMFFKSVAFEKCGKFDPNLFMFREEYDISNRLLNCGYHICYISELSFLHKVGNRRILNEHLWEIGINSYCYICKKYNINPLTYYSNKRLYLLFVYHMSCLKWKECLKIIRIVKKRNEVIKRYVE